MKNAHLETWDFGRPGWLNEAASGHIASPVHENIKFEVLAWTLSTNGKARRPRFAVAGPVVMLAGKIVSRFSEIGLIWIEYACGSYLRVRHEATLDAVDRRD